VITEITLFSKYMPIAMSHWRLYARPMIHPDLLAWTLTLLQSVFVSKQCFLFAQSCTQLSYLCNAVSNQPEIAVRLRAYDKLLSLAT